MWRWKDDLDYWKCNPDRQWQIWYDPFPLTHLYTIHRDDGWSTR